MGLSTSDIRDALRDWITMSTSIAPSKIIWPYQNAPEPTGLFMTINPTLSMRPIGRDEQIYDDNGDIRTRSRRSIMSQVDVYGATAFEVASNAYDGLLLPLVHDSFLALCLSAEKESDIRDLTALKDGRYENRASFDIRISAVWDTTTLADDLGWFDSAQYSGTGELLGLIPETTVN